MRAIRVWLAEHWRTSVTLNIGELEVLLDAVAAKTSGTKRRQADPVLASAAQRVGRARDKRLRAVERAAA